MRIFLTSRRCPDLLAASLVIALWPVVTRFELAFPGIIGGGQGTVVPLPVVAPLALAVMVAWALSARRTHLTGSAVRSTGWMDAALILGLETMVAGVTLALSDSEWRVTRNVLILVGLSAIGAAVMSPAAGAAAVTVFTLFVVTYGASAPGSRFVRVLQAPAAEMWPLVLAAMVTLTAVLTLALAPSRAGGQGSHS